MNDKRVDVYDVFVISDDVVGEKMAGPGIRAWELSKCLAKHFKVVLAIPDYSYKKQESELFEKIPFDVVYYSVTNPSVIEEIGKQSKILLIQGYILSKFPKIKKLPAHLICDLYVPFPLENLFVHKWKVQSLKDREYIHLKDLSVFNDQILHGDHFLCANVRQRDLFVGSLLSLDRINPEYLDISPVLDELISIVPFGISQGQKRKESVIKNCIPQIEEENIILLWGGVISNWFDPVTLIRSVKRASAKNPRIQLFFLSTTHPNPLLPEFDMAKEAIKVSDELGLTNKHVFFNHEWVDYNKRGSYFMEADVGVSIHKVHFETYYSFRTRILDYLKYDLPIICTEGDHFAEFVREKALGVSVGPENEEELAAAILNLSENKEWRERIRQKIKEEKKQFYWEKVSEPLIHYCQKVLSGEVKKKETLQKRQMVSFAVPQKQNFLKSLIKKYFWLLFQKLPFKFSAKIRRFFKF
jgi:glycosyltransferase involved in cell wall biosynthesis